MVSPQAMAADKWIRTTGGEEKDVHTGYQVTSSRVIGLNGFVGFIESIEFIGLVGNQLIRRRKSGK